MSSHAARDSDRNGCGCLSKPSKPASAAPAETIRLADPREPKSAVARMPLSTSTAFGKMKPAATASPVPAAPMYGSQSTPQNGSIIADDSKDFDRSISASNTAQHHTKNAPNDMNIIQSLPSKQVQQTPAGSVRKVHYVPTSEGPMAVANGNRFHIMIFDIPSVVDQATLESVLKVWRPLVVHMRLDPDRDGGLHQAEVKFEGWEETDEARSYLLDWGLAKQPVRVCKIWRCRGRDPAPFVHKPVFD